MDNSGGNYQGGNNINEPPLFVTEKITSEHDAKSLGNEAITNAMNPNNPSELNLFNSDNAQNESPQEKAADEARKTDLSIKSVEEKQSEILKSDQPVIKTTERLNPSGVRATDEMIRELTNPDEFYKKMQDIREQNLKNSYGKELAA